MPSANEIVVAMAMEDNSGVDADRRFEVGGVALRPA